MILHVVNRLISVQELRAVAKKIWLNYKLSMNYFTIFFSKRCSCHAHSSVGLFHHRIFDYIYMVHCDVLLSPDLMTSSTD